MGDSGSGGGGAGAGYNIPISVSNARSEATNPVFGATTSINFSSPFSSVGGVDSQASLTPTATATSSAAEGNAAASSQTPVNASGPVGGGGSSVNLTWIIIAGLAAVAIVATAFVIKRK